MIGITAEKVRDLRHLMHLLPSRGQTFFEEYSSKVPVIKKLQKESLNSPKVSLLEIYNLS